MKLSELAQRIGAKIASPVPGAGETTIVGCGRLEDAAPDQVAFLTNPKYAEHLEESRAAAVIVSSNVQCESKTLLIAEDPYFAFRNATVELHGFRRHPKPDHGPISPLAVVDPTATVGPETVVHPYAVIGPGAKVGARCVIYPHVYIGPDAVIGDECQLYPSVTVYDRCVLGHRVTLHAGCVIGQDGFGYATHKGAHHKIPQAGNAVIEDDVEMGANCSVDRATLGSTVVGRGTKFSNSVVIGHGTRVGRHNLYVALVGLAGSVETGDYVVMGGQVGIAGHLKIGNQVQIAATSGVMTNIPDKAQFGGTPAQPLTEMKRILLAGQRLPDMIGRVKQLERQVQELQACLKGTKPQG